MFYEVMQEKTKDMFGLADMQTRVNGDSLSFFFSGNIFDFFKAD